MSNPETSRFSFSKEKLIRSVFIVNCCLLPLSACDPGENNTHSANTTITTTPAMLRAIPTDDLTATVTVNGSSKTYSGRDNPDGNWIIYLDITPGVDYFLKIEWRASNVFASDVLIMEESGDINATNYENIMSPSLTKISSGSARFDNDCDADSNLKEISEGTDPGQESESGQCSVASDETTPVTPTPPVTPTGDFIPLTVPLSAGCFNMGKPPSDNIVDSDGLRYHNVCVDAFEMGVYEVTFEQYSFFSDQPGTPQETPPDNDWGLGKQPVLMVTQQDAVAYTKWLSSVTGLNYRLPTEAEWEYAARSQTDTPFWTGDSLRGDQENVNSEDPYGGGVSIGFNYGRPLEVGSLQANPWRLYDMLGNLSEWTCSVYSKDYTGEELVCSDSVTDLFSIRGANYRYTANNARVYNRQKFASDYRDLITGFRIVRQ